MTSDGLVRESWEITSRGEWLDRRRGLMTASRIAVLWDAHPYLTRDQVIAEMAGVNHGDNPAMRRGRILEPAVAAAVEEEKPGWKLRKATTFHTAPDHRLGATPDYFADCGPDAVIDGVVNVQCKTVNPHTFEQWRGQAPLGYLVQVAAENLLVDAVTGYLAIMVTSPGYPLHLREVPRHAAAEQKILTDLAAFWTDFDAGRLTKAAPSEEIAAAYDDGSSVDLSSDNYLCEKLPERERLKTEISAAEKQVVEIDAALKDAMGTASVGWLPGYNITFKAQSRKEVVIPAKTFRVLRIRTTHDADSEQ